MDRVAASGAATRSRTLLSITRLNARHIDQRRTLLPRDYAVAPESFGVDPGLHFVCPDTGDPVSMRVAELIHQLLCVWNLDRQPSAAALADRFNTSKQTISRVSRGERWPGETVLAALIHASRPTGHRGHQCGDCAARSAPYKSTGTPSANAALATTNGATPPTPKVHP